MGRRLAGILVLTLMTTAACAREGVYGYCGQVDTCRYDLPEKMLVRTYNGFIEPGSTSFAADDTSARTAPVAIETVEEAAADPTAPTPASIATATVSAPATTMVAISN